MARPVCCRRVGGQPKAVVFKPAGVPACELEQVTVTLDEFEALRLADLEGLYHGDAAQQMGISRPTFGRILESARRKIAEALVHGKKILIEGGVVAMSEMRTFICSACSHQWQLAHGTGCPQECPSCKSTDIHRDPTECQHAHAGHGHHGGGHGGCCRKRHQE